MPRISPPTRVTFEKVIRESMTEGYPTIDSVAQKFGIPVRTIQRRLQNVGLTYRELVDEVRYNAARRALDLTRKNVAYIAKELGFNDASNFSRAFHRWSGMTPTEYRAKCRAK